MKWVIKLGLKQKTNLPLIYVNQIGGQDELVFDGGSFALDNNSKLCLQNSLWKEEVNYIEIFNNKDNSVISRKFIYDSYIEHSKDRHTISASLFKKIKNFVGELKQTRRSIEGKRIYCIVIPKLEICQNLWRNLYRDQNWKFDYQDITDSDSDSDSDSEGNVISI